MSILNKLTIKHMTMNKKRTIVTIIGVILSTALIHKLTGEIASFSMMLIPWKSIIYAVIGVFIITSITMRYATKKIKKENILDAIREENI
ncbi:MAG: hypothetical protein GX190_01585 [Mollicutes bacterium]|nr:hypothetical protein [Mollicutes bacterium]